MAAPIRPLGAKSDKIWRDALMRAVKRQVDGDVHALERLADKTVAKGLEGDMAAIKEIGDRLDGRPHQSVGIGQDEDAGPLLVSWVTGQADKPTT